MEHIAFDLGSRTSQICRRNEEGEIVEETSMPTAELGSYLAKRDPSRVIVETSSEAFRVAAWAREHGHDVRVVAAALAPTLGVGRRGLKNDVKDAQVLSEVSCRIDLPSVHIPSEASQELKSLCTSRESLLSSRTQLNNRVRSWLRTQVRAGLRATPKTLPRRVREAFDEVPEHIEAVLRSMETLTEQIEVLNEQLKKLAKEDETCRRLMTVPGVGPVTAARFMAAIDDVTRFPNAAAVQSYLGLTPGECSSGLRQRRTGITKAGPAAVRRTLCQAAWSFWNHNPTHPLAEWADRIWARRNRWIALVALARKLAGILYAIWRDGTRYDRARTNQPPKDEEDTRPESGDERLLPPDPRTTVTSVAAN